MAEMMTLARETVLEGVGVHTGLPVELRIKPSQAGHFLLRRLDLCQERLLDPSKMEAKNSSCFKDGEFEVLTLEHLLASLYALGIGSAEIDLTAAEVPILDGSAAPIVRALRDAGIKPTGRSWDPIVISETQFMRSRDASLEIEPFPGFKISYGIEFSHPAIGRQEISLTIDSGSFEKDVAPARTFGFVRDLELYRSRGLAGGSSLDNTIGLDDEKVVNPPLRYPDEFVRHKVLDLIGDLALLGRPVLGHFRAWKAGHTLHLQAVRLLLSRYG